MATTLASRQAGTAYCMTQAAIYQELERLQAQLIEHQHIVTVKGTHWGHVGNLTDILALLQRITTPHREDAV